jgi:hypothetical protein
LAINAVPEPIIPDSIEPYIGYKAFHVYPIDDLFHSTTFPFHWPPQEKAVARCGKSRFHDDVSPADGCRCGFYAAPLDYRVPLVSYFDFTQGVVVRIALWGKTMMHTGGVRAQFAYPQKIVAWTCPNKKIKRVAKNYGIKVASVNLGIEWLRHPT